MPDISCEPNTFGDGPRPPNDSNNDPPVNTGTNITNPTENVDYDSVAKHLTVSISFNSDKPNKNLVVKIFVEPDSAPPTQEIDINITTDIYGSYSGQTVVNAPACTSGWFVYYEVWDGGDKRYTSAGIFVPCTL